MSETLHVKVVRPYPSVEAYVEGDAWTADRTGLVLVGQAELDPGTRIHFELTLESGQLLLRGEGRARALESSPDGSETGLRVRFRHLDDDSVAMVRRLLRARRSAAVAERAAEPSGGSPAKTGERSNGEVEPSGVHPRRVTVVAPPENRDALLDRLRERARRVRSPRQSEPPRAAEA